MAKLNQSVKRTKKPIVRTHEGAKTYSTSDAEQLRRSVMTCMLWENNFYEDGESIVERIKTLVQKVNPDVVYQIALDARNKSYLRHVPLLIARCMAELPTHKSKVSSLLYQIIQRPDELSEFLSIYWKEGKTPISNQVKKGLGLAFTKFDEYSLAKYNTKKDINLRDVLFLTHPKAIDKKQQALWDRLVKDTLKTPDTWEVELSKSSNKKESWERLLTEKKLGGLALIRNLRNMIAANVSKSLIRSYIREMKVDKILPFRFIAANNIVSDFSNELEFVMIKSLQSAKRITGKTVLLVDVSGSMSNNISEKSDICRRDAANGLAIILKEICNDLTIYTFSSNLVKICDNDMHGFKLADVIDNSQRHGSTELGAALNGVNQNIEYDRLIVITDEQSSDTIPDATTDKSYIINVASCQNGVGYTQGYNHINGWSENVVNYIQHFENKD